MKITFDEKEVEALELIVDYLWDDEEKNFEECQDRRAKINHIYHDLLVVDVAMGRRRLGQKFKSRIKRQMIQRQAAREKSK
jgi:hypothetical protein